MQAFIDRKLREIFSDFEQQAADVGSLCKCKGINWVAGNLPNYSLRLVQQHYLLRYFPAYLAEYYLMYMNMLRQDFLGEVLKVLSIGCGCGIDFWGLSFALRDLGRHPEDLVEYTGVDMVRWLYKDKFEMETVYFRKIDWVRMTLVDTKVEVQY